MSKPKFIQVLILPNHVSDLERSISRGVLNATEPIWLAAFACYNTDNKLRLSMEFDRSYTTVFNYIKSKLK